MLRQLFTVLALLLSYFLFSQNFEGKIYVEKKNLSDTVNLVYNVKGKLIRVDELSSSGAIKQSVILDIEKRKIVAVDPNKKLYRVLPAEPLEVRKPNDLVIKKSSNYKMINGYKCYQWRVKSIPLNTEVSYWVPKESFTFFSDMMLMLNTNERSLRFFMLMPDSDGVMPMLAVERTLMRKEKKRYRVLKIKKEKIQDSLFKVPDDYTVFNQ